MNSSKSWEEKSSLLGLFSSPLLVPNVGKLGEDTRQTFCSCCFSVSLSLGSVSPGSLPANQPDRRACFPVKNLAVFGVLASRPRHQAATTVESCSKLRRNNEPTDQPSLCSKQVNCPVAVFFTPSQPPHLRRCLTSFSLSPQSFCSLTETNVARGASLFLYRLFFKSSTLSLTPLFSATLSSPSLRLSPSSRRWCRVSLALSLSPPTL